MSVEKKPSFFARLFSGKPEAATIEPDAQGNITLSGEQFTTLEAAIEDLETEAKTATANYAKHSDIAASVEDLKTKFAKMEEQVSAHGERLEKLKTVPAAKPAATVTEPAIGAAADEADGVQKSAVAIALEEAQKTGETIRITA